MNTPLTAGLADMTNDELVAAYKKAMAIVEAVIFVNPDAELIEVCDRHAGLMDAVNLPANDDETNDSPIWRAYYQSCHAISDAEPRTMAGLLAVARAAKAEARQPNGQMENGENGCAAAWSWTVLNGLLRIENGMTIP